MPLYKNIHIVQINPRVNRKKPLEIAVMDGRKKVLVRVRVNNLPLVSNSIIKHHDGSVIKSISDHKFLLHK